MARYRSGDTIRDGNGAIVAGATVSVYLAGTTTAATVYAASSGGASVNSVTSATDGTYEFYVDSSDYAPTQFFKIVISKASYVTKTIDNIPIIPVAVSGELVRTVSVSGNILSTDRTVEVSPSVADLTLTLPLSSALVLYQKFTFYIPQDNSSGFGANFITQGSDTIDSYASSISTPGEFITLQVSGTKYRRVG